jgi:hypothetical protein
MKLKSTSNRTGGLPSEGDLNEIIAAARERFGRRYYKTVKRTYGGGTQVEVLTIVNHYNGGRGGKRERREACYEIVE